jgi:DNA-binding GntR family transcriptional regulator
MNKKRALASDEAYKKLLDLIVSDELSPDQSLSERGLSDTLGIGRMPVREAIRKLVHDGALEVLPARGTFVRSINLEQLHELYEVRQSIEGLAVFLAAQRGPTDELTEYGQKFLAAKKSKAPVDYSKIYGEGVDFHLEVFRAARNQILSDIYHPIRMRFRVAFGLAQHYDHEWVIESIDQHLAILRAIELGDGLSAQRLMRDHLARGYESKIKILSRHNKVAKGFPLLTTVNVTREKARRKAVS